MKYSLYINKQFQIKEVCFYLIHLGQNMDKDFLHTSLHYIHMSVLYDWIQIYM